ncbi:MAG TPA: hypothetical protein PK413_07985, partial [Thermoanaerobaculia bacterium]|nr:hypothetical protein [Thermoanaerobaculia bacterium]
MASPEYSFEEPLIELRRRIEELEGYPDAAGQSKELRELKASLARQTQEVYGRLSRWQKALVSRHPERPYTLDYIENLFEDWVELHGDRLFGDDPAIVAGLARFRGAPVAVIGHQKGRSTKARILRNFGQPRPEGYRKALRVMRLAEKYGDSSPEIAEKAAFAAGTVYENVIYYDRAAKSYELVWTKFHTGQKAA